MQEEEDEDEVEVDAWRESGRRGKKRWLGVCLSYRRRPNEKVKRRDGHSWRWQIRDGWMLVVERKGRDLNRAWARESLLARSRRWRCSEVFQEVEDSEIPPRVTYDVAMFFVVQVLGFSDISNHSKRSHAGENAAAHASQMITWR